MGDIDYTVTATSDTNDKDLLRSRIDQQSELICILKKRADEFLLKYNTKEEECTKLNNEFEKISNLYSEEQRRSKSLEDCYFNLGKTHQELLATKKEIDIAHEQLRKECDILKTENVQFLSKFELKESVIASLEETVAQKDGIIKILREQDKENISQFNAKQESIESSILNIKKGYHDEIDSLRGELAVANDRLTEVMEELEISKEYGKDMENQLSSAMNLYSAEKRRCSELEEKLHKKSERGHGSEKDALQKKIIELEEKHSTMIQNFNAYKGHAQELLLQERSLNNQLRRLKSPDSSLHTDSRMTMKNSYTSEKGITS